MAKPDWWPECPYPEDVFPDATADWDTLDDATKTRIGGWLGRQFWNIASASIRLAYDQHQSSELPNGNDIKARYRPYINEIRTALVECNHDQKAVVERLKQLGIIAKTTNACDVTFLRRYCK